MPGLGGREAIIELNECLCVMSMLLCELCKFYYDIIMLACLGVLNMHVGPFLIRRPTFVIWPIMGIIVYMCIFVIYV